MLGLFLEIVITVATCILAIATIFMGRSSTEMARATRQIAEIIETDRQRNHQPLLTISGFWKDSRKSEYHIRVKNVGKGLARWVSVQVGNSNWHAPDRIFATRTTVSARALASGEEDEWSISENDAEIVDGKLWVGVLYEGTILPPGAANFGTWASVLTTSETFAVNEVPRGQPRHRWHVWRQSTRS